MIKPILVVISYSHQIGKDWIERHPEAKRNYDWRTVTDREHLHGYVRAEYVYLSHSSRIRRWELDDFKARNIEYKGATDK